MFVGALVRVRTTSVPSAYYGYRAFPARQSARVSRPHVRRPNITKTAEQTSSLDIYICSANSERIKSGTQFEMTPLVWATVTVCLAVRHPSRELRGLDLVFGRAKLLHDGTVAAVIYVQSRYS